LQEMADVLLVDDDSDVTDVLTDVLHAEGHQVRVAHDGKEGLALLDERMPDVVVLDVEMPVLTGPDMAYQMFVHDLGLEDIPIVLCSGILDLPRLAAFVGTSYFLPKPFSLSALQALLARVLLERTPPQFRHRET